MSERGSFVTQFFYNEALFEDVAQAIEDSGLISQIIRGDRMVAGRWSSLGIPLDDVLQMENLFKPIAAKHNVKRIGLFIIDERLTVWSTEGDHTSHDEA